MIDEQQSTPKVTGYLSLKFSFLKQLNIPIKRLDFTRGLCYNDIYKLKNKKNQNKNVKKEKTVRIYQSS
jgi:hypothetical protein